MQVSKKELLRYTNPAVTSRVLGAIMKDPSLIRKYDLRTQDFGERHHRLIFGAINNLAGDGVVDIGVAEIDEYLSQFPSQYATFKKNNGVEYLVTVLNTTNDNVDYDITQLKKLSLLRGYVEHGIDVSDYWDPHEVDADINEEKQKKLNESSIADIINHFRSIQLEVSAPFRQAEIGDSKKAGVGGMEQKERWKKSVAWGIGYSSGFLTEILHGMRPKMYTIKSAGTGVGKTRTAIADIAYACSPEYYDPKERVWRRNPNGTDNGALYIGTEMELLEEIDPILWAYISNVPQDHIKYNEYLPGEEERVDKAIKLLEQDSNIWLEYLPEFNIASLEDVIEQHVLKHGIQYVFFDYIHTTTNLISEYQSHAKAKIAIREDQVLLDLSSRLKQMARDYDVCINTATQVNGQFKDEHTRDQTLVAGSKAVVNKADNAMIAMPPTTNELATIQPILDAGWGRGFIPNLVYSVYKVRDSQWNKVKIWLYVDYSTMRIHDLFVTNYDYELMPELEPVYIDVKSDTVASRNKPLYDLDGAKKLEKVDMYSLDNE